MDRIPSTEEPNPSTAGLDRLDTLEMLHRINDEDRRAAAAVERELGTIATAVDAIAERLSRGGSLHYFGAGTSGRLGAQDAAEIPPTFSTPPSMVVAHIAGGAAALSHAVEGAEDDAGAGADEVRTAAIGAVDAVVGISASGRAAYVVGALTASRRAGALTIALTNADDCPLSACADVTIALRTGAEALAGSTRMKAAASAKMALTMMSTAIMVKLGRVHGNLMIDVDPSNEKLRARALRLTQAIANVDEASARAALDGSGYRVKVAVIMLANSCDPRAAEDLLTANGGSLRAVLAPRS
jgi:N-acetylmuramic acid 6-phosphate etherase